MCAQGFLYSSAVKSLPAMQETWVQFLGQEDPLEQEMATYSSILAWRIPWTEEPGRLQSTGLQELDMTKHRQHSTAFCVLGLATNTLSKMKLMGRCSRQGGSLQRVAT